ncbi:MAG: hypothetical protein K9H25_24000 [Rhodospirillum sp.]|nr:hypothetical protein [Rhodospirillum sp.]MCF8489811.1 hypothetical protein [Rhodospirillum sp.]MCF8501616.1 hypothetical protein [Rhodospirillum sp.]
MLTIRLLFGGVLAALFAAGTAMVGGTLGLVTALSALGLFLLPSLVARILDETVPLDLTETGPESREMRASESFAATGANLLGREGRPFAFSSLSEARRCARRHLTDYGITACDGAYFLTDRRLADREMARAHIRSTYALIPGGLGLPVLHLGGAAPEAPLAVTPIDRLRETRQAMRNADPLDRLTRDLMGSEKRLGTA